MMKYDYHMMTKWYSLSMSKTFPRKKSFPLHGKNTHRWSAPASLPPKEMVPWSWSHLRLQIRFQSFSKAWSVNKSTSHHQSHWIFPSFRACLRMALLAARMADSTMGPIGPDWRMRGTLWTQLVTQMPSLDLSTLKPHWLAWNSMLVAVGSDSAM